ncbi:pyridoxal phosphate-dependent class II aminotransferase [Halogeometricum borinquense]|uniref:Aminotransferase n=1 Tax=Halogeometricum borinquense TaxID=60847 RepID=A0A6C0UJW3_9EURY|nr:aminotransferase class I/II-fold pyridoxal phosphate-dependent enzyme [Halogeometricum borinquense]QIB73248.1 pyridoxal phosphate-dependent class II aminotransferase [Halogeometricum borinquense]QIQ77355.1 pyridoxal phosphate-dependent class II aminotransferase [Halogeometricum borinquense]
MNPDAVSTVSRVPHGGADDVTILDFSANTNPNRPSGIAFAYESALATSTRYPSDDYVDFRVAAAEYVDCDPHDVIPTAGGMAALRLAFGVTVGPGDDVLLPEPSFGEYDREIRLQGATPVAVAHDEILETDPRDYAAAVICNPNNPTGEAADPDELRAYLEDCRDADTVLIVDEAFLDFTDDPSLAGEPGVIVARSLTKMFGLPGLRAGFAVATAELGEKLNAARQAWSLSTPAADVGEFCMRQQVFVTETKVRVRIERERMRERLSDAFEVYPSDAPFLLLGVEGDVDELLSYARERGFALRDARTFPTLDSHVRVAVRRPQENDKLVRTLLEF